MEKRSAILVVAFTLLVGAVAGAIWMRSDNSAREGYLDKQFKRLDQEWDSAALTRKMSDAEFQKYAASVHEQSRIARNVQERLHEQELVLAGAESKWISLVIVAIVVAIIAAAWIARSTNERARITIQNALGLPPEQMRGYLVKSQIAATLSMPELPAGEPGVQQAAPRMLESGQGGGKRFHPPARGKRRNRGTRKKE